jgi:NitT/TauT family transport system substrate-binding protein
LNVKATTPDIPFSSMMATVGRQFDLIVASQPDLIHAVASGIPNVAVAGVVNDTPQDPAAGLVMSPKSGVTDIKQMAGHSVGAPSLTGNNWGAFMCWLDKSGVKLSSVRGVRVPPPELTDVLKAGRVEGGLIFNPILNSLKEQGYKYIGDPYQGCFGNGAPNGYWTGTKKFATDNKEALAKFVEAEKEAKTYIESHKAEARATYVKLSGLPPDVAKHAVIYTPAMDFDRTADQMIADLDEWKGILKKIGQLPPKAPESKELVVRLPSP